MLCSQIVKLTTTKFNRRNPGGCIDPRSAFELIQFIPHQELLFVSRILTSILQESCREYYFILKILKGRKQCIMGNNNSYGDLPCCM